MNYLSLNIKYLKDKEKLSEESFGALFGLKRGAIQSYISEKANPKSETLQKISERYKIKIDQLLNSDLSKNLNDQEFEDVGQGLVTPKNDNNMIEVLKDRIKDKDDYINNLLEQIKDLKIRVEEYKGVFAGVKKGSAM